jgi:hypothetical protein
MVKHSQNCEKTGNILWLFDALSKFRTVFLQWLQDEGDGEDRYSSNTSLRFSIGFLLVFYWFSIGFLLVFYWFSIGFL